MKINGIYKLLSLPRLYQCALMRYWFFKSRFPLLCKYEINPFLNSRTILSRPTQETRLVLFAFQHASHRVIPQVSPALLWLAHFRTAACISLTCFQDFRFQFRDAVCIIQGHDGWIIHSLSSSRSKKFWVLPIQDLLQMTMNLETHVYRITHWHEQSLWKYHRQWQPI